LLLTIFTEGMAVPSRVKIEQNEPGNSINESGNQVNEKGTVRYLE